MWMLHMETCHHGDLLVQSANSRLCRALQPCTRSMAYCYNYSGAERGCYLFYVQMWNKCVSIWAKNGNNKILISTFCWCGTLQSLVRLQLPPQTVSTWQQRQKKSCLKRVSIRKAMLWWLAPQLHQHVSNNCMTAYSYQMSNIRAKRRVDLPRGFKNAALEHDSPAQWTTNYTLMRIWETLKRSDTIFSQLNQSLTVIPPPTPTLEDSHSVRLVSCSNKYEKWQKNSTNWIFSKLKHELLRTSHNIKAQIIQKASLWHLCHKSTPWYNDELNNGFSKREKGGKLIPNQ